MKNFLFLCGAFFCFSVSASAQSLEGQFDLFSRNMPQSCEFVFRVDSEIKIVLINPPQDLSENPELNWWLIDAYSENDEALLQDPLELELNSQGLWEARLGLQSFSASERYLYRRIRWSLDSTPERYEAQFGRDFGEACYRSPEQTPWKRRLVERVE